MLSTDVPAKFQTPFAAAATAGTRRAVPSNSQPGGAASLADGFPAANFQPVASGGIPPFGQDMNGILFVATGWDRWFSAGGPVLWDSSFSTAIGGYPLGAEIASPANFGQVWRSTVDNNLTNPDAGGAGWVLTPIGLASSVGSLAASNLLTTADRGKLIQLSPNITVTLPAIPPPGMPLSFYANGPATITGGTFFGGGLVGASLISMAAGDTISLVYTNPNWVVLARNSAFVSFNGRVGVVTLTTGDVVAALGWTPVRQGGYGAMLNNSVSLGWDGSGALLAAVDSNTTVIGALASRQWVASLYAPLASPVLSGNPQTPTPAFGATASIVNTAYTAGYYVPITNPHTTGTFTNDTAFNNGGPISTRTLSASVSLDAPTISAGTVVNFSTALGFYSAFINSQNGRHTIAHVPNQWFTEWDATNGDSSWTGMAGGIANRYMTLFGDGRFTIFYTSFQPGGGSWNAVSDARIKDVHGPYETGLAAILRLEPRTYSYRGNDGEPGLSAHHAVVGQTFIGLIAQEAEAAMPELVTRGPGIIDGERVEDFRTLNASAVTYALINAVKELAATCADLEFRLARLDAAD